jgi:hypothetical protein
MITGQDKFHQSFYLNELGQWTLRTPTANSITGGFDVPPSAIVVQKTSTALVDTFTFYSDLAKTTLVKTIVITYTTTAKIDYTVEATTP